ncbi:perlucin-like [Branchiostoma floridae x Branchiostoma belcheri]
MGLVKRTRSLPVLACYLLIIHLALCSGDQADSLYRQACNTWGCSAGYACAKGSVVGTPGSGPHWRVCVECQAGYVGAPGACVKFSTDRKSYQDARTTCQGQSARLVAVKTAELDGFIANTIRSSYQDNTWIGLDDLNGPTHHFVWSDGSILTYNNWYTNQPDFGGFEQCVEIRPDYGYHWNNHECHFHKHFVCEKSVWIQFLEFLQTVHSLSLR